MPGTMSSEALDELFSRDPRKLTDDDIREIIQHYRKARQEFIFSPKTQRKSAPLSEDQAEKLTIDDLDIKLP